VDRGTEGYVRLPAGAAVQARELAQSVLPLGEAAGERWGVAVLLTIDAMAAAELGRRLDGGRAGRAGAAALRRAGDSWGRRLALIAGGAAARGLDRPDRAVELLEQAVRLAEEGGLPAGALAGAGVERLRQLERGDLDGRRARRVPRDPRLWPASTSSRTRCSGRRCCSRRSCARGAVSPRRWRPSSGALSGAPTPALLFPPAAALAHRAGILLQLGRTEQALAAARGGRSRRRPRLRAQVLAHAGARGRAARRRRRAGRARERSPRRCGPPARRAALRGRDHRGAAGALPG
jgi:hypothetical protein